MLIMMAHANQFSGTCHESDAVLETDQWNLHGDEQHRVKLPSDSDTTNGITPLSPTSHIKQHVSTPGRQFFTPGKFLDYSQSPLHKTPNSRLHLVTPHCKTLKIRTPQQENGTAGIYQARSYHGRVNMTPPFCSPSGVPMNPFELDLLDRLHKETFSPGVFAVSSTPGSAEKGFHWNIEHNALLHPADIEEMPFQQDTLSMGYNRDMEEKAQKAIDLFFSQDVIVPSPHTDSIHKSKIRTRLNKKGRTEDPSESQDSPMIFGNAAEQQRNGVSTPPLLNPTTEKQEVACQTALTLPVDFDIHGLLGDHMVYEGEEDINKELNVSSLRRKLNFQGEWHTPDRSSKRRGKYSNPMDYEISPPISPVKCDTPQQGHLGHMLTPGSNQFSSSPIHSRQPVSHTTPSLRRCSTVPDLISSPELSPISSGYDKAHNSGKKSSSSSLTTPLGQPLQATPSTGRPALPFGSPGMSPICSANASVSDSSKVGRLPQPSFGRCSLVRSSAPGSLLRVRKHKVLEQGDSQADMSIEFEQEDDLHAASQPLPGSTHLDHADPPPFLSYYQSHGSEDNSMGLDSQENDPGFLTQDTGYNTNSLQLTGQDAALHSTQSSSGTPHTNLTNEFSSMPVVGHDTGVELDYATDASGSFLMHEPPASSLPLFRSSKPASIFKPAKATEQDMLGGQYFDRDLLRSVKQNKLTLSKIGGKDNGRAIKSNAAKQLCMETTEPS